MLLVLNIPDPFLLNIPDLLVPRVVQKDLYPVLRKFWMSSTKGRPTGTWL